MATQSRDVQQYGGPARGSTSGRSIEHPWSRRDVAVAAALWVGGALLLALMSVMAHQHAEFPGDIGLAEAIQRLHQPLLDHIINFASDANWPKAAGIIAIAIILGLLLLRQVRAAIGAVVAGFGADAVNVALNGLVARPRPNNVHIHAVAHLGLHSFPSGHVTHVMAFYGFLLYLSIGALRSHPHGPAALRLALRGVQVICLYFLVFIGPSRVLEGEHWPSDVIASYLLGALMLAVAVALYHLLSLARQRWSGQRPSGAQPAASPRA